MSRAWYYIIPLFIWICCPVANAFAGTDTTIVPPAVQASWKLLQDKDALSDWLYARIAFVEENPAQRINWLMKATSDAWRSYSTYPERLAWFDVMALQAYYQLQLGNILASIHAYENALQFYEAYPLPEIDITEEVLKPLGNNYTRLADYDMALLIHHKALTRELDRNNKAGIAAVYSNMAVCARWKGDIEAATEYCNNGLAYSSGNDPLYGLLLTTYADILSLQSNKQDSAWLLCRQALAALKKQQHQERAFYWYGGTLQLAASLALNRNRTTEAAAFVNNAEALYQLHFPDSKQREKAKIYVLKGNIELRQNNAVKAASSFQQALQYLLPQWHPRAITNAPSDEILYGENTIGDALEGKAKALQQMSQPLAALQHLNSSFIVQTRQRRQFFYTNSKLREIQVSHNRAVMAMQLAFQLWKTTGDKQYATEMLCIAERSKAQVLLDERAGRNNKNLRNPNDSMLIREQQLQQAVTYYRHELLAGQNNQSLQDLLHATEYELAMVQKKLPRYPDNALLSKTQTLELCNKLPREVELLTFFEGDDTSFLISAGQKGVTSIQVIVNSRALHDSINGFMQHWFFNGPSAMVNDPHSFFNASRYLYNNLFGHFQWNKDKHYLLSLDGVFNYLPFDALLTSDTYSNNFNAWPYLYKKAGLSRAWSLQTWSAQQQTQYKDHRFTGFFIAAYPNDSQPELAVGGEYKYLRQELGGSYYIDSAATMKSFKTADGNGIVHMSLHAGTGVMPFLQLYDGPLFLSDLQYSNFAPALLVLGACRTANGNLIRGEGLNSLERAFVAAGAGGVLSGLWNLNDESAVGISRYFYQQLKEQPNAAQALQNARMKWLSDHKEQPLFQLPYYWAGFIYSGHLQKIQPQTSGSAGWLLITGAVMAMLAIAFVVRKSYRAFLRQSK